MDILQSCDHLQWFPRGQNRIKEIQSIHGRKEFSPIQTVFVLEYIQ